MDQDNLLLKRAPLFLLLFAAIVAVALNFAAHNNLNVQEERRTTVTKELDAVNNQLQGLNEKRDGISSLRRNIQILQSDLSSLVTAYRRNNLPLNEDAFQNDFATGYFCISQHLEDQFVTLWLPKDRQIRATVKYQEEIRPLVSGPSPAPTVETRELLLTEPGWHTYLLEFNSNSDPVPLTVTMDDNELFSKTFDEEKVLSTSSGGNSSPSGHIWQSYQRPDGLTAAAPVSPLNNVNWSSGFRMDEETSKYVKVDVQFDVIDNSYPR